MTVTAKMSFPALRGHSKASAKMVLLENAASSIKVNTIGQSEVEVDVVIMNKKQVEESHEWSWK